MKESLSRIAGGERADCGGASSSEAWNIDRPYRSRLKKLGSLEEEGSVGHPNAGEAVRFW